MTHVNIIVKALVLRFVRIHVQRHVKALVIILVKEVAKGIVVRDVRVNVQVLVKQLV